jgi:mRNA interferase HigB
LKGAAALRVISKKKLREFWGKHQDAESPLNYWYRAATKATWQSIADVRDVFPHADAIYDCTVFNIGGNQI